MAVNEFRLVHWRIGPEALPREAKAIWKGDITYANSPAGVFEALNDGYKVVSHQVLPFADGTGDVLLSLFLARSTEAPSAPSMG